MGNPDRNCINIPTLYVQISKPEGGKLMSNNQLLRCDKSKLYSELVIIVTKREIKMNKSTDMEP